MQSAPYELGSGSGGENDYEIPLTVNFLSNKFLIIKEAQKIAPFVSVDVTTKFTITFLHSRPTQLLPMCHELFVCVDKRQPPISIHQKLTAIKSSGMELVGTRNELPIMPAPLSSTIMTPLQDQPASIFVTNERLYLQPRSLGELVSAASYPLNQLVGYARRYKGLKDCAVELYWNNSTSLLIALEKVRDREKIIRCLNVDLCFTDRDFLLQAFRLWKAGKLTNFQYLLVINSAAGRTFQDLSRYPVFPWVVADYQSPTLDLGNPSTFRDLSKPMGALNEERLQYFQKRYEGMVGTIEQPFLYGTHYSAPGYVLYYLIRSMPEQMLFLQNGKFDAPDRIFSSIEHCFNCAQTNHADVKELIPEFYSPSHRDVLTNTMNLDLGATQTGDRVHDVLLPNWAKSPRDFLKKCRAALECQYVSDRLPQWLDLIFGAKSRGEPALAAHNLFHPMAYLGPADLAKLSTEQERVQAELQAVEFGIVPDQLFARSHPTRDAQDISGDELMTATLGKAMHDYEGIDEKQEAWELLEKPRSRSGTSDAQTKTGNGGFGSAALMFGRAKSPPHSWPNAASPKQKNPQESANSSGVAAPPRAQQSSVSAQHRTSNSAPMTNTFAPPALLQPQLSREEEPSKRQARSIALSGSGEGGSRDYPSFGAVVRDRQAHQSTSSINFNKNEGTLPALVSAGWDMKMIEKKKVHSDRVSGCALIAVGQAGKDEPPLLVSTSLDGTLCVNKISLRTRTNSHHPAEEIRRGFTDTLSRFPYIASGLSSQLTSTVAESKLTVFRTHSASDPLACLSLTTDGSNGHVVFCGGHDDVVLAYGINSACAVASVYSHRDAVTGLDVIMRPLLLPRSGNSSALWSDSATHIMVSGSWDATVKVWSVAVASGETVSIHREPLAELFDADSTIVSLSAAYVVGTGLAICTGCSDGSLVVWLCHDDGTKVVIHKEPARRGSGPCSVVKWTEERGQNFLFCGFSTGKLLSFSLQNNTLSKVNAVSVGIGVHCLEFYEGGPLLVGCSDGGLRLLPLRNGAAFHGKPTLWNAVNGKSSPGLTSINISVACEKLLCTTGAEDGSVAIFELKEAT